MKDPMNWQVHIFPDFFNEFESKISSPAFDKINIKMNPILLSNINLSFPHVILSE